MLSEIRKGVESALDLNIYSSYELILHRVYRESCYYRNNSLHLQACI